MSARWVARLLLLVALIVPGRVVEDGPAICLFRRLTGRPCPACGMSRSWSAAAHGRPLDSFRWHPFGLLTIGVAVWLAFDDGAERWLRRIDRARLAPLAGAWLGVWLARVSRRAA